MRSAGQGTQEVILGHNADDRIFTEATGEQYAKRQRLGF
jgi:hypothetical protein